MKLLIYCTKAKPYLLNKPKKNIQNQYVVAWDNYLNSKCLNGKVVAECDFSIEKIYYNEDIDQFWTKSLYPDEFCEKSCLSDLDLFEYLDYKDSHFGASGFAIHLKNLSSFEIPKQLQDYDKVGVYKANPKPDALNMIDGVLPAGLIWQDVVREKVLKAPQNMMYVWDGNEIKILISIQPQWVEFILNKQKTIEVRRKVLKAML